MYVFSAVVKIEIKAFHLQIGYKQQSWHKFSLSHNNWFRTGAHVTHDWNQRWRKICKNGLDLLKYNCLNVSNNARVRKVFIRHCNCFQKRYASDSFVEFKMADKMKDSVKSIIKCLCNVTPCGARRVPCKFKMKDKSQPVVEFVAHVINPSCFVRTKSYEIGRFWHAETP